jgi:hypothetical protein
MEMQSWHEPRIDSDVYRLTVYELSLADVKPHVFDDEVYYKLGDLQKATRITTVRRAVPLDTYRYVREGVTRQDLIKEVLFQAAQEIGRRMLDDMIEKSPEEL